MAVRKRFAYLGLLNHQLDKMRETGVFDQLMRRHLEPLANTREYICSANKVCHIRSNAHISLNHEWGIPNEVWRFFFLKKNHQIIQLLTNILIFFWSKTGYSTSFLFYTNMLSFCSLQDAGLSSIGLGNVGSIFYLVAAGIVGSLVLFLMEHLLNKMSSTSKRSIKK